MQDKLEFNAIGVCGVFEAAESSMTDIACLDIGSEPIPGYRLRRFRGRGGFGGVWEADSPNGEIVALKFLRCDQDVRASQESRAIQSVRKLQHAQLIRIDDIRSCPGFLVIAMELADGSLQDLFDAYREELNTPIPTDCLWPLIAQTASVLDFLNQRHHLVNGQRVGFQHCDIKPSNLLLFGDMLKLSDFSLTTAVSAASIPFRRAGTLEFAAPEIYHGRLSDRSDQYSLAVTYHLVRCGRLPFEDLPSTFRMDSRRIDLSILPQGEHTAVARALSSSPIDRWPSCETFVTQLQGDFQFVRTPCRRERRGSVRQLVHRATLLRTLGSGDSKHFAVVIRDISRNGIGLESTVEFKRGTILALTLPTSNGECRSAYLRVVRVLNQPEEHWLLGCTFARPLDEEVFQTLQPETNSIGSTPQSDFKVRVVPSSEAHRVLVAEG